MELKTVTRFTKALLMVAVLLACGGDKFVAKATNATAASIKITNDIKRASGVEVAQQIESVTPDVRATMFGRGADSDRASRPLTGLGVATETTRSSIMLIPVDPDARALMDAAGAKWRETDTQLSEDSRSMSSSYLESEGENVWRRSHRHTQVGIVKVPVGRAVQTTLRE